MYSTGKIVLQGKKTKFAMEMENLGSDRINVPAQASSAESSHGDLPVFIVHGHDTVSRDGLELLIHRMGLEPIILQNLPTAGDTIIEKLEHYLCEHGNVGFACVLLTPDDEGHRAGHSEEKKYRARQNVVLELGMILGRLGRRRVAILHKGSVELPSDISGLLYISFTERVEEVKTKLFHELKGAGFNPKFEGL